MIRCGRIHLFSKPDEWYYIPTDKNLANIGLLGLAPQKWPEIDVWLNGGLLLEMNVECGRKYLWKCVVVSWDPATDKLVIRIRAVQFVCVMCCSWVGVGFIPTESTMG